MRKCVLGLTVLTLLLSAGSAQAESEYGQELGGYLALGLAYGFNVGRGDIDDKTSSDTSVVSPRAGFRLGPELAIELEGDWNYGFRNMDMWVITTNFRWYYSETFWSFPEFLQLYAVGGVGLIGGDVPKHAGYRVNGAFRTGLGIDFYVTPKIAINVGSDMVFGTGTWSDAKYVKLGAGVQYNF